MNGAHAPNVNITQNGEVSYSAIPTMPSSTHSNQMSLSQGIGQMSMTDVNLEQALERIQELHRENNELRDYLKDNNEKMKVQYQNLSEWKEKIRVNNARNKEKFDQTKEVVLTLTRENAELKAEVSAKIFRASLQLGLEMFQQQQQEIPQQRMKSGGLSDAKKADAVIQTIIEGVKEDVEANIEKELDTYDAISYKTQVVAGTNYFVKVNAGDEYLHLRIFAPLPCTGDPKQLIDLQRGKAADDEITYF